MADDNLDNGVDEDNHQEDQLNWFGFYKGISKSWFNNLPRGEELTEAARSPYFLWWAFVQASRNCEFPIANWEQSATPDIRDKFGNLDLPFEEWWGPHGRELFRQTAPRPKIEFVHSSQIQPSDGEEADFIYVKVPLIYRRQRLVDLFWKLLHEKHPGDDDLREAGDTSKLRLNYRVGADYDDLRDTLHIVQYRQKHGSIENPNWHMVAKKMPSLAPKIIKVKASEQSPNDRQALFRKKLSGKYKLGINIMANAIRGSFPNKNPVA